MSSVHNHIDTVTADAVVIQRGHTRADASTEDATGTPGSVHNHIGTVAGGSVVQGGDVVGDIEI